MHNITNPVSRIYYIMKNEGVVVGHGYCDPENVFTTSVQTLETFDTELAQSTRLIELGYDTAINNDVELAALSVEQQRHVLKHRIDNLRAIKLTQPLTFDGNRYDMDMTSIANVTGVLSAVLAGATLPGGFTWRSYDNADVPFTSQTLIDLAKAGMAERSRIYQVSWNLKKAVEEAEDPLSVDITVWIL